jgi:hypothetical protein
MPSSLALGSSEVLPWLRPVSDSVWPLLKSIALARTASFSFLSFSRSLVGLVEVDLATEDASFCALHRKFFQLIDEHVWRANCSARPNSDAIP